MQPNPNPNPNALAIRAAYIAAGAFNYTPTQARSACRYLYLAKRKSTEPWYYDTLIEHVLSYFPMLYRSDIATHPHKEITK